MLTLQVPDLVVNTTEARVESPVHLPESGFVERDLMRDRFDGAFVVAQLIEGGRNVGVDTGAYPAQDGGSQAGRLLYPDQGDRLVRYGGFDAHQQTVLGPTADGVDGEQPIQPRVGE